MHRINIGFSPCPNDTFIFDALVHERIENSNYSFQEQLLDVEALNQKAMIAELEVTKLSFHAFMHVIDKYELLHSGSALGNNCGPLLISKTAIKPSEISSKTVAIPGELTTANFLLDYAFPDISDKLVMTFDEIEEAVLDGRADLGLIIHENRFTYASKGLIKVMDLGEYWETKTTYPIPLGGIAIRRDLSAETKREINQLVRQSIEFAFNHPDESLPYTRAHAQEMDTEVMQKHINLYVNDYSIELDESGKQAIEFMYSNMVDQGRISPSTQNLFVEK